MGKCDVFIYDERNLILLYKRGHENLYIVPPLDRRQGEMNFQIYMILV